MSDSMPTVQELDKHLKKLVAWKRFAVHLPGMDMSMIDTIVMSNCGGCPEQKLATYNKWLHVCPNPSWEHIINALEILDENRLAQELKEKLYINSRNSAEQHKPSCLGQPFAEIVSTSCVKLYWEKPQVNSVYVTKYVVSYCTADTIDTWVDYGMSTTAESMDIEGLNPNDTYIFKVKAFDHSGNKFVESKSSKSVKLVKALPEPPGKPTAKTVSESSITIEWTPPKNVKKRVKIYIVSYSLLNNEKWNVLETSKTIATIANLVPNMSYLFKVQARWESEESQVSKVSIVRTNNAIPGPPGKPQCKSAQSDHIALFRKSPTMNEKCVEKYKVFKPSSNSEIQQNFCEAKSKIYKEYGPESMLSDAVKTKPLGSSPPGKPTVVSRTCNSIELEWEPPTMNADSVNHYLIYYTTVDAHQQLKFEDDWPCVKEKYRETRAKIQNLETGMKYCFRVAAICDDNFCFSDSIYGIRTKYLPPNNPPGKPYAEIVTERSVLLKWKKSYNSNADQDKLIYHVYIIKRKISSNHLAKIYLLDTLHEEAQISNLSSNTEYFFQIEAVNLDGDMEESEISDAIITKKAAIPGPPPGKPYILGVTHEGVKLAWEKPSLMPEAVSHYVVHYKHPKDSQWKRKLMNDNVTSIKVCGLHHSTAYIFKVVACSREGECSIDSEISEPVVLRSAIPSAPGKPERNKLYPANFGTVNLTWTRPKQYYENVKCYEISYYEDGQNSVSKKSVTTNGRVEKCQITQLTFDKGYYFDVKAVTGSGEASESSFLSDLITSDNLAETFLPQCEKIIDETYIPTYLLPKKCVYSDDQRMLNKYDIKLVPINTRKSQKNHRLPCPSKVLMLVGATGSGKTTLINGIVNYIMGVEFGDQFRYKLVHDTSSQTESVTKWITAYTLHHEPCFQLPYSLTIVDTPGFGDTEGIERDKQITHQIKHFLNTKGDISHIDGVGLVCQAGSSRLSPTQRYIFDSVFAIFGNDIKDSIFIFCTFCDGEKPKVIKAVEEANIPVNAFFKFNNFALYTSSRDPMTELFWNIGKSSYTDFFEHFAKASSVSLALTKEVLQQRENLMIILTGVQKQITTAMHIIDRLKREIVILETERATIEDNKGFEYEVEETVIAKVNLANKECTTNCLKCNMTCHYPCPYSNDKQKKCCIAMDNSGRDDARCAVCPGKCHWSDHRNQPFRLETETRLVRKEYAEMKRKYEIAVHKNLSIENVIDSLKCQCDSEFEVVFNLIQEANICTKKLDEIAFCPNHLTDVEYIQLLIDAQLQEKKKGYQERIKYYQMLQERAETLAQIKEIEAKAVQGDKRWWEAFFMT